MCVQYTTVDALISDLNRELKLIMDKIRTLGLSKKQDKTVSCIAIECLGGVNDLCALYLCTSGNVTTDSRQGRLHKVHGAGKKLSSLYAQNGGSFFIPNTTFNLGLSHSVWIMSTIRWVPHSS